MEEFDKQQNKQEQKEDGKEKREQTLKVVITSSICTLLFIVILLLLVLLGLKKCQPVSNGDTSNSSSSSQPVDTERNNRITDVFKDIVNKQMQLDGFDSDDIKNVVAVIYEDNYPTQFGLNIIVNSETKVYYYYASDVNYPEDKSGYDNFVSYLLMNTSNHVLNGDITLSLSDKTNEVINTSKTSYKAIISKSASNDKYLSGFYYENNNFFVYQKRLIVDSQEPFTGVGNQRIDNLSPLYDYYRDLLEV